LYHNQAVVKTVTQQLGEETVQQTVHITEAVCEEEVQRHLDRALASADALTLKVAAVSDKVARATVQLLLSAERLLAVAEAQPAPEGEHACALTPALRAALRRTFVWLTENAAQAEIAVYAPARRLLCALVSLCGRLGLEPVLSADLDTLLRATLRHATSPPQLPALRHSGIRLPPSLAVTLCALLRPHRCPQRYVASLSRVLSAPWACDSEHQRWLCALLLSRFRTEKWLRVDPPHDAVASLLCELVGELSHSSRTAELTAASTTPTTEATASDSAAVTARFYARKSRAHLLASLVCAFVWHPTERGALCAHLLHLLGALLSSDRFAQRSQRGAAILPHAVWERCVHALLERGLLRLPCSPLLQASQRKPTELGSTLDQATHLLSTQLWVYRCKLPPGHTPLFEAAFAAHIESCVALLDRLLVLSVASSLGTNAWARQHWKRVVAVLSPFLLTLRQKRSEVSSTSTAAAAATVGAAEQFWPPWFRQSVRQPQVQLIIRTLCTSVNEFVVHAEVCVVSVSRVAVEYFLFGVRVFARNGVCVCVFFFMSAHLRGVCSCLRIRLAL
jgi:hypothetical protein